MEPVSQGKATRVLEPVSTFVWNALKKEENERKGRTRDRNRSTSTKNNFSLKLRADGRADRPSARSVSRSEEEMAGDAR